MGVFPRVNRSARFISPLTALVLITLVIRGAVLFFGHAWGNAQPFEVEEAARHLAAGKGLFHYYAMFEIDYKAELHPVVPMLLGGAYKLFGADVRVAQLMQVAASVAVTVLAYGITRLGFDTRTAFMAGVLATLHPGLNVYSAFKITSEIFDVAGYLLLVFILVRLSMKPTLRRLVLVGLAIGLGGLVRGPYLAAGGLAATLVVWRTIKDLPGRLRAIAAVGVISLLVIAPWLERNREQLGSPVLLSTTGYAFWIGNNPHSTGTVYAAPDVTQWDTLDRATQQMVISSHQELTQQAALRKLAMDYVEANPVGAVKRWLVSFGHFWWFTPTMGALYPGRWFDLYKIYYAALLPLACAGFVIAWRKDGAARTYALVFAVTALSIAASQSPYYVEGRHRWEIEVGMLTLAAVAASELWRSVAAKARAQQVADALVPFR